MATPQGNPVRRFLSDLPAPPVEPRIFFHLNQIAQLFNRPANFKFIINPKIIKRVKPVPTHRMRLSIMRV